MKLELFSIYDEVAQAYIPPFYLHNREVATRAFIQAVNDPNHQFHQSPKDYTLYHLGSWADENAEFEILPQKVNLGTGLQFFNKYAKEENNEVSDDPLVQPST